MTDEISYSDGGVEERLLEALKSNSGDPYLALSEEDKKSWAVEYHLSEQRHNLLRHLNFSGKRVLEIGAGMGAISTYIAPRAKHLTLVEGTSKRLSVALKRLEPFANVDSFVGNFRDFVAAPGSYDVITVIGVLEYAEMYFGGRDPFVEFLAHAASLLADDGKLILAIENRIGIKYWSGATEDHTGSAYDGILGYKSDKSPRTFSKFELTARLQSAGFTSAEFQYPVPDYKLPTGVIKDSLVKISPRLFKTLLSHSEWRDYTQSRMTLFSSAQVISSFESAEFASEFSNSFLVIAGKSQSRQTEDQDDEMAWFYSSGRKKNTQTVFKSSDGYIQVCKSLRDGAEKEVVFGPIKWRNPSPVIISEGDSVAQLLRRNLIFREWSKFDETWTQFFKWVFATYGNEQDSLKGESWDVTPTNSISAASGLVTIDEEWVYRENVRKSWLVLRSILSFDSNMRAICVERWGSLYEMYRSTCDDLAIASNFEADRDDELTAQQAIVQGQQDCSILRNWIDCHFGFNGNSNRDHVYADLRRQIRPEFPSPYEFVYQVNKLESDKNEIEKQYLKIVSELAHKNQLLNQFPINALVWIRHKIWRLLSVVR